LSFPAYPKYKDSGVEWLGEVPEHWEVEQTKRLFKLVADPAPDDNDYELLSIYTEIGVRPRKDLEAKGNKATTTDGYWKVRKGDLIVNKLLAWMGAIGISDYDGVTSPAYDILRQVRVLEPKFYDFLFRCGICFTEFRRFSRGIMDMRLRLYFEDLGQLRMPFPPPYEQKQIVDFLLFETAKIDSLVAEQQRLIELLKEKRQAVISHAVTKGLNPNVRMKDSGIEWLGEVPEHWDVKPLKYLARFASGGTPSKTVIEYWDGDVPWASSKDLKSETLADTIDHITQFALAEDTASLVPAGSVLVVVRGMILLHTFPVVQTERAMAINQDLKAITAIDGVSQAYLPWLLRGTTTATFQRIDEAAHGTKVLRMEAWTSIELPVPPPDEQLEIVAFVMQQRSLLESLTAEAQRAIDLLQERHTALISTAVTGKIDVREFQSETPVAQKRAASLVKK
jgi:type I restriction enzyme, S subunit